MANATTTASNATRATNGTNSTNVTITPEVLLGTAWTAIAPGPRDPPPVRRTGAPPTPTVQFVPMIDAHSAQSTKKQQRTVKLFYSSKSANFENKL